MESCRAGLRLLVEAEGSTPASVEFVPAGRAERFLRAERPACLHDLNAARFDVSSYLRGRSSDEIFPITCMQYGFSTPQFLSDAFTRLMLPTTYPCDSVICASHVAREATIRILDRVQNELARGGFTPAPRKFRLDVIPHGVALDIYKPRDRVEARRQLELPANRIIILYMGRVDPAACRGELRVGANHRYIPRSMGRTWRHRSKQSTSACGAPPHWHGVLPRFSRICFGRSARFSAHLTDGRKAGRRRG